MSEETRSVDETVKQAHQGLKWTVLFKFSSQMFNWIVTLIVIRFLTPLDYGLQAMSGIIFAFLFLLATSGFNGALIQSKSLSKYQIRQLFTLIFIFNFGLSILQFLAAPLIASYYNEERLIPLIQVLSIGFLLSPFVSIHNALMNRELAFKKNALINLAANLISSIVTLISAIMGLGVWALIIGQLLSLGIRAVLFVIYSGGLLMPTFNFSGIKHLLTFGTLVLGTTVLEFAYYKTDILIGGHYLGAVLIGYYAIAYQITSLPMNKIVPILNQIAFPTYSRLQNDQKIVQHYFLKSIRIISLIMLPLFAGLGLVSDIFVDFAFGERWADIAEPISVLCTVLFLQTLYNLFQPAVDAIGHPKVQLINAIIALVIMIPAMFIGVQQKTVLGICYTWLFAYSFIFMITSTRSLNIMGISHKQYLTQVIQIFPATILMALSVYIIKISLHQFDQSGLSLLACVVVGMFSYIGGIYFFNRNIINEFMAIIKKK